MYRRSLAEQVGPYDTSCFGAEDYEMWLRMAARGRFAALRHTLCVPVPRTDRNIVFPDSVGAGRCVLSQTLQQCATCLRLQQLRRQQEALGRLVTAE